MELEERKISKSWTLTRLKLNEFKEGLGDLFMYLGSSVSSTESDINMHPTKVWTAIDNLSIIWKSGLSDKLKKRISSKQWLCQYYSMDALHGSCQNVLQKS